MAAALRLLVVLVALAAGVSAYPTFWAQDLVEDRVANCLLHPGKAQGLHGAPGSNALVDTTTTFTVSDSVSNAPVTGICPGGKYAIKISFAEPRRALLTSSIGSLNRSEASCPGRSLTEANQPPATLYEDVVTVPCNATGAVDMLVTSAAGKSAPFNSASSTLPVLSLAECPASTCPGAGVGAANAAAAAKPKTSGALRSAASGAVAAGAAALVALIL